MKWFSALNIRNKLILIILVISLCTVTLVGIALTAWNSYHIRQEMELELSALTKLLGDRSSAALVFDNVDVAEENLISLKKMPKIVQACLYRIDGSVIAQYKRDEVKIFECTDIDILSSNKQFSDSEYLYINLAIKQGSSIVGWINMTSDLTVIENHKRNQIVFTVIALIPATLFTILLASWAQRFVSNPIVEITDVARAIDHEGDHDLRAKVYGKDEVGELAETFNNMLDALEKKNQQLRRSQKMEALGKLTGGIAHDYNNMLGVVLGYAELLESMLKDQPKLEKYAYEIQHAGQRGAKLTKKLLAFSRQRSTDADVLNINSLLNEIQHMLAKTLTARVTLVYDLEHELHTVWLDRGDLGDVILNMSINAMHAIEDVGQLTIQTRNEHVSDEDVQRMQLEAGDYVLLSIIDNGSGIDEKTRELIFDPFYSTKGEAGTGLGLSQAYGFVKSNGGVIKVYSEVGYGTEFTLYFPRYYINKNEEKQTKITKTVELKGTETILVVDDEESLRMLTKEILSDQNYNVLCAESASEALKILQTTQVDLLLSDVIMPEMDGYQLASMVQKEYPDVKIQLCSGFSDDRHLNQCDESLKEKLLAKPFASRVLLLKVREALDGKPS